MTADDNSDAEQVSELVEIVKKDFMKGAMTREDEREYILRVSREEILNCKWVAIGIWLGRKNPPSSICLTQIGFLNSKGKRCITP